MVTSREECFELLWKHNVPSEIIRHCIAVSRLACEIAKKLESKGKRINMELLDRACLLHDIGKLESIEKGGRHEQIGYNILVKHGLKEIAEVIRKHPLHYISDLKNQPKTWEEKILYYADKRVINHKIAPLKKRLEDLYKRYPQHADSIKKAEPLILKLEKELLR